MVSEEILVDKEHKKWGGVSGSSVPGPISFGGKLDV